MSNNTPTVSLQAYIRSGAVQERIEALVGERAGQFTTSLMSTVNSNPLLQECTPESVVKAAVVAAGMSLPIDPGLGLAYIVPYLNTIKSKEVKGQDKGGKDILVWTERKQYEAQFQMGWKGFVRLAIRSNEYRTMNVTDVRMGEYVGLDRMTGEHRFDWMPTDKDADRKKLPIVGYVAYFELKNGFSKMRYSTVEELEEHAKEFSQNYKKYGTGQWKSNKHKMSLKTVLKLLLGQYGPLSVDLVKAIRADQASLGDDDQYDYLDNKKRKRDDDSDIIDQTPVGEAEPEADQTPAEPGEAEGDQTPPADEAVQS